MVQHYCFGRERELGRHIIRSAPLEKVDANIKQIFRTLNQYGRYKQIYIDIVT